jgi:hypothetical protein
MPQTGARPSLLWNLAKRQWFDPAALPPAIEQQIHYRDLDFRSKLLIRDAVDALREVWGPQRTDEWFLRSPLRAQIESICAEDLGRVGFPFLKTRLVNTTKPADVQQFLRELGARTLRPARIVVGGSAALILREQLDRQTDAVDVVDEIPAEIRTDHAALLQEVIKRFKLQPAHFQSHYLPHGWESRVSSYGRFGQLDVALVDTYDIAASKLMSPRTKDRDDLRALVAHLDKQCFTDRIQTSCAALLNEPDVRKNAELNWYVLYGEQLPA